MKKVIKIGSVVLVLAGVLIGFGISQSGIRLVHEAEAAGGKVTDPKGTAPDRYVYYPGTESLGNNEIRLIACGTGMPGARRGQAATCFLVELGDGQKFLFDIGTGAMRNVQALMIPANYLTKIFLTHLHTDHWGDLSTLWAGGWTAGRTVPLEVWGPSGAREDMGDQVRSRELLEGVQLGLHDPCRDDQPDPGRHHGSRVRLQGYERCYLRREGREDPFMADDPRGRRPGQLRAGVERLQDHHRRRYGAEQVGDRVRQGRGPVRPRGLHDLRTDDDEVRPAGAARAADQLYLPHFGPVFRQDHEYAQAALCRGVSLFQRRRHALPDLRGNPRDVRRPALDGDRQHDVEYQARQDHGAHGCLTGRRVGRGRAGREARAGSHTKARVHPVHPRGRPRHDRREQELVGQVHEGARALA